MTKHSFIIKNNLILIINIFILSLFQTINAEHNPNLIKPVINEETGIRVYLDARTRDVDENFIKTEIDYVNYVMDPQDADVHILITTQNTGGGGNEFTLNFIGQKGCSNLQNTLTCYTTGTDTDDEIRQKLLHILKLGLVPYIATTPLISSMRITYYPLPERMPIADKWNSWLFNIRFNTQINGEASYHFNKFDGRVEAERITENTKTRINARAETEKRKYEFDDYTYISTREDLRADGLHVMSIGGQWSVGGWLSYRASSYQNIDLSINAQPAIEYNVFPYSQSTSRQLRILYRLGYEYVQYREMTIFDQINEHLLNQNLSVNLEFTQPWGRSRFSVSGSHYFHDLDLTNLSIWGNLSIRLFRGLSFDINGRYTATKDLLSLAKGEASTEDVLLQQRQLASNYQYGLSLGFSYRFGSMFNNVVNPRFGR